MRRKKAILEPTWLIWEGNDFPSKFDSESVVFYISEHLYLDEDNVAKKSLAKQLQLEGIVDSLSEGFKLIDSGNLSRAGYFYEDGEDLYPTYCDNDDSNLDYDATFVEVPYVF
jgi:hypothetical protein